MGMRRFKLIKKWLAGIILFALAATTFLSVPQTVQAAPAVKKTTVKDLTATDSGMKLTWKKVKGAGGYYILRSVNGGKFKKIKTIKKASTVKYTDKKVKNGKQYQYRVKVFKKKGGKTVTSALASSKKRRFLTKPKIIGAAQDNDAITVSWGKNSSCKSYELKYTLNGKSTTIKTKNTSLTFTVPSVLNDTNCAISLRGLRTDGSAISYSPWSKTTILIRAPAAEPKEEYSWESAFDPDSIPDYSGEAVITVNGDEPFFTEKEKQYNISANGTFILLSPLDDLGRCGAACACVGKETEPTDGRESISHVYPSGWIQRQLSDGTWLYNRSHLLMFALTGLNDDNRNLITGTRQFNADNSRGMYGWEMTAKYAVDNYNAHVLYRVTPVFRGDELVARGVLMEAYCIEYPEECTFCRFVYNVQDNIEINYATGESVEITQPDPDPEDPDPENPDPENP